MFSFILLVSQPCFNVDNIFRTPFFYLILSSLNVLFWQSSLSWFVFCVIFAFNDVMYLIYFKMSAALLSFCNFIRVHFILLPLDKLLPCRRFHGLFFAYN